MGRVRLVGCRQPGQSEGLRVKKDGVLTVRSGSRTCHGINIRTIERRIAPFLKKNRGAKEERPGGEQLKGIVFGDGKDKAPRACYIKKSDAERHGYTRGCGGCSSWFSGLGRQLIQRRVGGG